MINPSPLCPGHPTHHPGLGVCILTWRQGWGAHWPSAAHLGPAWSHTPQPLLCAPHPLLGSSVDSDSQLLPLPAGACSQKEGRGPGSRCLLGEHWQQLWQLRALGRQGSFPRALKPTPAATGAQGL